MNIKLKLIIFGVTAFLIAITYYDGKYMNMLMVGKNITMVTIAFGGYLYLFIKKHPNESKVTNATNLVKYMPIDSNTADFITPFFAKEKNTNFNNINISPKMKECCSEKATISRSHETKEKYVASKQS